MNPHQVILITGGGRGLGRAFALALAQSGAQVAVTARSESELAQTVALIEQAGGRALALPADVTDQHAVARVVAAAAITRSYLLSLNIIVRFWTTS